MVSPGNQLAAVDKADNDPHKDPPGAQDADDQVEEVVGLVPFYIGGTLHHLWLLLHNHHVAALLLSWRGLVGLVATLGRWGLVGRVGALLLVGSVAWGLLGHGRREFARRGSKVCSVAEQRASFRVVCGDRVYWPKMELTASRG